MQETPRPRNLPCFGGFSPTLLEIVVAGERQRLVQHGLEIAAVDTWSRPPSCTASPKA